MGYNTVVTVLNDAFDQIRNDPEFGKNLVDHAIRHDRISRGMINSFPSGNHCNPAQIVSVHHADVPQLVMVRHNLGTPIYPNTPDCRLFPDRRDMEQVVGILNMMGFSVTWPDGRRSQRHSWMKDRFWTDSEIPQ